jgi:hypothetical protein
MMKVIEQTWEVAFRHMSNGGTVEFNDLQIRIEGEHIRYHATFEGHNLGWKPLLMKPEYFILPIWILLEE